MYKNRLRIARVTVNYRLSRLFSDSQCICITRVVSRRPVRAVSVAEVYKIVHRSAPSLRPDFIFRSRRNPLDLANLNTVSYRLVSL